MTERERRRKIIDHLKAGQPQDAADELAGSRESYPGDGLLHHAIGLAFASNGTLEAAREQLESAASLNPDSALILADLAQVRLAQGKLEEAIESAENAIDLDDNLPIAHFTLGRACLTMEISRQAKHRVEPTPGFDFPMLDGRTPAYLKAVREMEIALDAKPNFNIAVHAALAFAYLRAGHLHAALEQLRNELLAMPPGEEYERVADRFAAIEFEIYREEYWENTDSSEDSELTEAEQILHKAHGISTREEQGGLDEALSAARAAGYAPRQAMIRFTTGQEDIHQQLADVHLLIIGGLECVWDRRLRFLPFSRIATIDFDRPAVWRMAKVELSSGEVAEVAVPSLYRLSYRSPNELIQSGRFTQFRYLPGETRYARALGSRNWTSENGVIPFADMQMIRFI